MREITTLDRMDAAVNSAVSVSFNGKEIVVILKTLSSLEIQSCGDFSLINLNTDISKGSTSDPIVSIAKFAEIQHKVLKLAMVSPTYEEAESVLLRNAGVEGFNERMRAIVEKFTMEKDERVRSQMEKEFAILEMRSKFFFPQDFLIDVFTFATQQDVSDIKKLVSEEILLNAAIAAEKGCCRVSDILCKDGYFSEFNRFDVDIRGAIVLMDHRKKK